jgi:hypothetical protein
MNRFLVPLSVAALAMLSGCPNPEDEQEDLKPVDVTVGVAIAEPGNPANPAIEPAVAYDGTRVHMVYCQNSGAAVHDLFYVSKVGAGGFSPPAPVFPGSAADSRKPHVFLDGSGTLHIVWEEGTSPNREVFYATINSSGTISPSSNLSNSTEDEANPRVHTDSSNRVHVVWEGATPPPTPTISVFYRRTQGSVFLPPVVLPKSGGNQPAEMPDITTDEGDRVYVVWSELNATVRNIRMVRSDDNGTMFGTPPGVAFAVSGNVDMTQPRVAGGADGEVFLCFVGLDSQGERGMFVTYTRSGYSMAGPGQLAASETGGIRDPSISAFERDSGDYTVMVAWSDGGATGGNILVHASHDNGANYPEDPTDLSQGNTQPASNLRPMIAMDDNELIAVWQGQPQGGGVVRTWTSNSTYKLPKD